MIWIGLLILGAVIVGGTYVMASFEVGSRIAVYRIPYVAGAVVGGLGLYMMIQSLPKEREDYAWAVFSLSFAIYVVVFVWRAMMGNTRAGNVMLDLGRSRGGGVFGIVGLVATLYLMVSHMGSGIAAETAAGDRLRDVSFAVLYGGLGVALAITCFTRSTLNERGILVHGHLTEWEKIRGFHWDERTPHVVVLERKARFPLRPALALPVPPQKREAVTELLTRKSQLGSDRFR